MLYRVHRISAGFELTTLVVIGADCVIGILDIGGQTKPHYLKLKLCQRGLANSYFVMHGG
jgi:hypothetical protein